MSRSYTIYSKDLRASLGSPQGGEAQTEPTQADGGLKVVIERQSPEEATLVLSAPRPPSEASSPPANAGPAGYQELARTEVDGRPTEEGSWSLLIDGHSYEVSVHPDPMKPGEPAALVVEVRGQRFAMEIFDERRLRLREASASFGDTGRVEIKAPMPGKVVKLLVSAGDQVEEGQGLVLVEAMKMENELRAPRAGTLSELKVAAGQTVEGGAILAILE